MVADVTVEREIAAPVARVWPMITDVSRMGEWSPETVGARFMGGAALAGLGVRFKGRNRNRWHRWSVVCEITEFVPERLFTFEPRFAGRPYATWSYELEPRDDGCLVRESWTPRTDRRSRLLRAMGPAVSGVKDRTAHNRKTMTETLDRLSAAAEG